MPYVSDAQRRWAHTEEGTAALGGPDKVKHWDKVTKGKELPEHAAKKEASMLKQAASLVREHLANHS